MVVVFRSYTGRTHHRGVPRRAKITAPTQITDTIPRKNRKQTYSLAIFIRASELPLILLQFPPNSISQNDYRILLLILLLLYISFPFQTFIIYIYIDIWLRSESTSILRTLFTLLSENRISTVRHHGSSLLYFLFFFFFREFDSISKKYRSSFKRGGNECKLLCIRNMEDKRL